MSKDIEITEVNGWHCAATFSSSDIGSERVLLELSKNFGATWPRVALEVEASRSPITALRVAGPHEIDEKIEGSQGFEYARGIKSSCVGAIVRGMSFGLEGSSGVDLHVATGGVAAETSPKICEFAAEAATRVLLGRMSGLAPLAGVLDELSRTWVERR